MNKLSGRLLLSLFWLALFFQACRQNGPLPDPENGGLFMPDGFKALVVADSVGPARHLAVSEYGDIYVKLRSSSRDSGNVALHDIDGDGRADTASRFGDYPKDGSLATEMRIHNGYLYI